MWSNVAKNCEKLVRTARLKTTTIVWVKQTIGEGRRVPKFGAVGGGTHPESPVIAKQQHKARPAGDGNRDSQKQEQIQQKKPVTMAAGKRIPLIKFPNRRAGESQGSKAVGRASGGGGQSQAMPTLPSGTASSQPPRAILSEAEIEAVLLGGVVDEPDPKKKAVPKKK
ncbi:hypothetical protein KC19_4G231300 [Ceratodon purpureus]|uniref:Uncharacterized protein n=1 Tax=Ceratodon purpureus TaxID=3225 RepID=A0A8T0IBT3_CERPU|nr:hypothetical protein KC19_4G231300 [Ceratodon purpureus]